LLELPNKKGRLFEREKERKREKKEKEREKERKILLHSKMTKSLFTRKFF